MLPDFEKQVERERKVAELKELEVEALRKQITALQIAAVRPRRMVRSFLITLVQIAVFSTLYCDSVHADTHTQKTTCSAVAQDQVTSVSPEFNRLILDKVNKHVQQYSWNSTRLAIWHSTLQKMREKILSARNIIELDSRINEALRPLSTSHTQFLTINDESFYLLHCLFASDNPEIKPITIDFTGIANDSHTVRYVLDHSPAFRAGIKSGDEIMRVNGAPFLGQLNFFATAGKSVALTIRRADKDIQVSITPEKADLYKRYVEAIKDSVRVFKSGNHAVGYIHYWIGGKPAHEILESALSKELALSDGLILDLRDGYGAAWIDDLDYFYRPENAYPKEMRYSKPVVVLVNGGTRSGKEALAYSLQHSGRAKLIGARTTGAFLPGKFFPFDSRTAIYLATRDCEFMGKRLEGTGVSPDIEVHGSDAQYAKAVSILEQQLTE